MPMTRGPRLYKLGVVEVALVLPQGSQRPSGGWRCPTSGLRSLVRWSGARHVGGLVTRDHMRVCRRSPIPSRQDL